MITIFIKQIQKVAVILFSIAILSVLASCEKKLSNVSFGTLSDDNFFKTADDANAAVNAMYAGLMGKSGWSGWSFGIGSFSTQAGQTTDEAICYWDDGGSWKRLNRLDFTPDFTQVTDHYITLMPMISEITLNLSKIEPINMDAELKKRYVAELRALRGYYTQILYLYYGPVPVRLDAGQVNNPAAPVLPRPSRDEMVKIIIDDFNAAIPDLPDKFTGTDYGRFSKAACYTSLLKLYMQEKRWKDAIIAGQAVKAMGFNLLANYGDLFNINNKAGNNETILPIVCSPTAPIFINIYRPHYLPSDYYDTTTAGFGYQWGGFRMPWKTYDKFDKNDYRLQFLLQKYPTKVNGNIVYADARAKGDIGAVMLKYGPDPTKTNQQNSGVNIVVMRYADVELLLAEAINEDSGPTEEAYNLLNDVRVTHGKLPPYPIGSLTQSTFRTRLQDERLFELWAEGVRRDDLIRWGQYIQRAKDDGYPADDYQVLYPLPRSVVNQSNGVIAQNPGYN